MNNTIAAKDAEINKPYSINGQKIVIIEKTIMSGEVISVSAMCASLGTTPKSISNMTLLSPYDEELINETTRRRNMENNIPTTEKKMPRSKVIDTALAEGVTDVNEVANRVIAAELATEENRKSVVTQTKTRMKWYSSGKKVNPFAAISAPSPEPVPAPAPAPEPSTPAE